MSKPLVLFDLDGTLTDPGEGIVNSVVYALGKYGITADRERLKGFIGPPLYKSFQSEFGFPAEKAAEAIEFYREYFRERGIFENFVYDGIPEMLSSLKDAGFTLAVATSKPEIFAVKITDRFNLSRYFSFVAGSLLDNTRVEKADVIRWAIKNCPPHGDTAMVGDRRHDIEAASQTGLASVGVLWGYGSAEELQKAGAGSLVSSPSELSALLLNMFHVKQ